MNCESRFMSKPNRKKSVLCFIRSPIIITTILDKLTEREKNRKWKLRACQFYSRPNQIKYEEECNFFLLSSFPSVKKTFSTFFYMSWSTLILCGLWIHDRHEDTQKEIEKKEWIVGIWRIILLNSFSFSGNIAAPTNIAWNNNHCFWWWCW